MAYRANKKRTRRRRKAESPEMRRGVGGLNISTYSRFPKPIQDAFVDGYEAAKAAYGREAYDARTAFKRAKSATFNDIREHARERDQLYLSEGNNPGKAFREGVRAGIRVVQEEVGAGRTAYGMRFNRKRRNSGTTERRAEALADRVVYESDATDYRGATAWIRRRGTKEMKARLKSRGPAGQAFRKHLQTMAGFPSWAARAEREGAFMNPRRRNLSARLVREAKGLGLSRSYVQRHEKRHAEAWQDAPGSKHEMSRTPAGTLYWDVTSAHRAKYRYSIKKLQDGYVAEFKKRAAGSLGRYISPRGSTSPSKHYYRTQNEAFRVIAKHILDGKHLPHKNPARRRKPARNRRR